MEPSNYDNINLKPSSKVNIVTNHPIAYESKDYQEPFGTARDNTKNGSYVRELIRRCGRNMHYMDIGCSGGGFVRQFLEQGVFAVGVEGSDYCLKHRRAEWSIIPDNLFTADITKPFQFTFEADNQVLFDAISAWDVLEHIDEKDLPQLLNNLRNNLKDSGLFIASIATFVDDEGLHVTLHHKPWWDALFKAHGFEEDTPMVNWGRPCNQPWNIPSDFEVVYKKISQL
jgi:2-polyprenyl-3-methyl-5-hydroxy-6-metoxy-1,4-benzoquinol methylase